MLTFCCMLSLIRHLHQWVDSAHYSNSLRQSRTEIRTWYSVLRPVQARKKITVPHKLQFQSWCEIPFAQPAPTQLEAPTYIPEFRLHLCRVEGCVNLLLHRNLTTGNIKKSSLQHHSLLSYHYHYSHISPDFPGEWLEHIHPVDYYNITENWPWNVLFLTVVLIPDHCTVFSGRAFFFISHDRLWVLKFRFL